MSDWPQVPLGTLCTLINGRAFKPSDWVKEGVPIVRIQNLNDPRKPFNFYNGPVRERFLIDSGEILLSWSGTPGTSFGCFVWEGGNAILNQHIFKVHVDPSRIDRDFFVHAVNSILDKMISLAHGGVGLRHITKGKLEGIRLPLPPLPEQRRIVARIKECLERVEEIRRLREEAERETSMLRMAILDSLLDATWPELPIGSIATDISNGWSMKEVPGGVSARVLKLSCVHGMTIQPDESRPIVIPSSAAKSFQVQKGNVFVVRGNGSKHLVGRSAISLEDHPDLVFGDLLIRISVGENVRTDFLNYVFNTAKVRRQIESKAKTAAGIWKINQIGLKEILIPCPSIGQQSSFVERAKQMLSAISDIDRQVDEVPVHLLNSSILRRAFAGEL